MPAMNSFSRLLAVTSISSTLLLAGCGIGGIDGIELQGGVFDALGLTNQDKTTNKNVKVAARPGLVLPPTEQRLPPPTDAPPVPATVEAWPVDPETRRVQQAAELDRRHKEVCEREMASAQARGEDTSAVKGPKGLCQVGIFGSLTEAVEGKKK
ncbi:MAG: hypothetical protein AB7O43_10650 [Hyphomicrobiaceae bacterium]